MKTTETLADDIYKLMETKDIAEGVSLEDVAKDFGVKMEAMMLSQFDKEHWGSRSGLRLSSIGKQDRQLWHGNKGTEGEKLRGSTYIKFLYGHLIEDMLLALVKLSGHTVTDEQKLCTVAGVKGSMDCRIDGEVCDVKSTSSYSFKKFKDRTLAAHDAFGYIDQLKAYAHSEGETVFGWLAMDKQNGTLCYLKYDTEDEEAPEYELINHSIEERIEDVKKLVEEVEPPPKCYEEVPDGKSGNLKLAVGCSYCQYKHHCWPELKPYFYSTGVRYLTKVVREPKVQAYDHDF